MPYRNLLYFGPNTIMYCLLLTSIMMSATTNSFGQFSGIGEIVNYNTSSSGCGDPDCNLQTNPEDLYQFIVPWDGSVTYSAILGQHEVFCCGFTWTYIHSVQLINHNGGQSVGTRFQGPGTFGETIDCLHAGDTIQLRFFGTGGGYNFSLDFTPDPTCEQEPNDTKATAVSMLDIDQPQTGCIAYVDSKGSNKDGDDFFELGSFSYGDSMRITFDVTEPLKFMMHRASSSKILANWSVNPGSPVTQVFSFPADDIFYLQVFHSGLTKCVQYEFDIDLLGSFPCDVEQNDSKATATIPDDLGNTITGCLSFKGEDYMDYISLGHYLIGDTIDVWIDLSRLVNFAFHRENAVNSVGNIQVFTGPTLFRHIVTVEDDYYVQAYINPTINVPDINYWIDLDACPTDIIIQNQTISGQRSARETLTLINCTIESDLTLSAPNVNLNPTVEIPLSQILEIQSDGCSN